MDKPSLSTRKLARKLLAASQTEAHTNIPQVVLVSERLRVALTRFAGADGFTSLLRRAMVLASAEVPALRVVRVSTTGRLEGLEDVAFQPDIGMDAAVAITAQVLELLITFIGEPFTMRLVRDAWPNESLDGPLSRIEDD
ncbi:MAG: hypothetical protein AABZ53_06005 [Planctomycetota bacterium]